ncbi:MAG: YigZ family protein [Chloroflexota bacterium]
MPSTAGPAEARAGYRTLAGPGEAELVIKRSRFLGHGRPIGDEPAAQAFLALMQKEHWQASHNCYAYVLGRHDEIQRSSDAGEPAGTAGRPILETIKKEGLKNTIVVVTRYFGGTLLGAGGLTRAYGQSATAALRAGGIVRLLPHRAYAVATEYHSHDKVVYDLREQGLRITGTDYTDRVVVHVLLPAGSEEAVALRLRNITNGRVDLIPGAEVEVAVPDGAAG